MGAWNCGEPVCLDTWRDPNQAQGGVWCPPSPRLLCWSPWALLTMEPIGGTGYRVLALAAKTGVLGYAQTPYNLFIWVEASLTRSTVCE